MPKRALIERRPWLLASLIAGIGYFFLVRSALPGLFLVALKGTGVGLLAIYAWRSGPRDARQIASIMACGALGDILIEYVLEAGAVAFLIGHTMAIALYWRHRRIHLPFSQTAAAAALVVLTPAIAWLLPVDRSAATGVAFYGLAVGAMAAAAWISNFSRYRVGIGAVMFVVSDLLIFTRMGPLAGSAIPDLLVWPLYYCGQFLICIGVVAKSRAADRHPI